MEFKGKVIDIRCHKDNGWGVYLLYDGRVAYSVTGVINKVELNDELYVEGDLTKNKYGEQIKARIIKQELPSNVNSFAEYLRKNIYGMGPITARLIVDKFKEHTFDVIANEPQKLAEVKGISKRKADDISSQFIMLNSSREEQMFFIDLGITDSYMKKIKEKYQQDYKEIITNNPYQLIKDIEGIGFKKADTIAEKLGIPKDSPHRIKSGIIYTMDELITKGNVYYPKEGLINSAKNILHVNPTLVEECLDDLIKNEELINDDDKIYSPKFYNYETELAKNMVDILNYPTRHMDANKVLEKIKLVEHHNNTELDESQRKAVLDAIQNNVIVITGGPGTGKTTTLNILINYLSTYETRRDNIVLAAPTGRAAKRMTEQTGMNAKTIHRLIGLSVNEEEKKKNINKTSTNNVVKNNFWNLKAYLNFDEDDDDNNNDIEYNPIEYAHTIIIDEMSMVDLSLMNTFIKYVKKGVKLVLVGDVDQLPSVGAGTVLKDLINSGIIPVAKLIKIHRQAKDSYIIQNAHKINNGEFINLKEQHDDFFFAERKSEESTIKTIKMLLTERIPNKYNVDSFDVQILAPVHGGELGVDNLNNIIQDFVNPPSDNKAQIKAPHKQIIFREGDKVIHIKNNYNIDWVIPRKTNKKDTKETGSGVFNGEIGKIISIDKEEGCILIKYDERIATYDIEDLVELELAYATTIHKSQGSEYPAIIIPLFNNGYETLYNRNLLYTAVTRAKDCVAILGNNRVVYSMIENTKSQIRYTYLANRLKDIEKETQKVGKLYA